MSRAQVLADFPTNIASGAIGSGVTGGAGLSGSTSLGVVTAGTLSHGTALQGWVDASNTGVTFPAGHVIQIRTATTDTATNFGAGAGTWTAIAGMTQTITPLFPDSKILIHFNCGGMIGALTNAIGTKVTGTTTGTVQIQSRYGYRATSTNWIPCPFAVSAIDTPGTIATQTYAFYCMTELSVTANRAKANDDSGNDNSGTTILYEIKV